MRPDDSFGIRSVLTRPKLFGGNPAVIWTVICKTTGRALTPARVGAVRRALGTVYIYQYRLAHIGKDAKASVMSPQTSERRPKAQASSFESLR